MEKKELEKKKSLTVALFPQPTRKCCSTDPLDGNVGKVRQRLMGGGGSRDDKVTVEIMKKKDERNFQRSEWEGNKWGK